MCYVKLEVLEPIKNEVSIAVLEHFLGLDPNHGSGGGGSEVVLVWLGRLDASVATVVHCLAERETRGGTVKSFMQTCTEDSL